VTEEVPTTAPEAAPAEATPAPAPRTRLEDLQPKMKLTGKVKKVELFGAFIDVGVGRDGLAHISALSTQRVNQVADVVKEGDDVTVWVRKVDPKAGRLDLTLIEPMPVDWDELKPKQIYNGKVTKLEKFGAFVDIGAERPGLVHISELASYRVEEVSEIVKVGDEVRVKVLSVDSRKKQIKLSLKALEEFDTDDGGTDEEALTAMQIAMQKAQASQTGGRMRADRRVNAQKARQQQEDLLSRTLDNKRK
jgi:ribosomal protein S1